MDLTAARRNALKPSQFAGPHESFPVNDATHARLALAMASRSQNAGNLTPDQAARIKARARNALITYDTPGS